jgi:hypothetical protein
MPSNVILRRLIWASALTALAFVVVFLLGLLNIPADLALWVVTLPTICVWLILNLLEPPGDRQGK